MVDKTTFTETGYPIHIVGRHLQITEPMKAYALEKLAKIDKFGGRVIEATIAMDIQKLIHSVDYVIIVNNTKIKVSGRSDHMYASIDKAIDRLEAKLSRYLKRLNEHHTKPLNAVDMVVNVYGGNADLLDDVNDQIEEENLKQVEKQFEPHKVVKQKKIPLKTLTKDEALMKMELSGDSFMAYRSEEDQTLKVIYRDDEGNFGIIEVEPTN